MDLNIKFSQNPLWRIWTPCPISHFILVIVYCLYPNDTIVLIQPNIHPNNVWSITWVKLLLIRKTKLAFEMLSTLFYFERIQSPLFRLRFLADWYSAPWIDFHEPVLSVFFSVWFGNVGKQMLYIKLVLIQFIIKLTFQLRFIVERVFLACIRIVLFSKKLSPSGLKKFIDCFDS